MGSNFIHRFVNQCQALGGTSKLTTANTQPQYRHNANADDDSVGKMYPPGAGQQHQRQQMARQQPPFRVGSPHRIRRERQLPMQSGSQHSSDCSGPPPVLSTRQSEGGGHPVKRVSTDTLLPPHTKRRITGKTGPRSSC